MLFCIIHPCSRNFGYFPSETPADFFAFIERWIIKVSDPLLSCQAAFSKGLREASIIAAGSDPSRPKGGMTEGPCEIPGPILRMVSFRLRHCIRQPVSAQWLTSGLSVSASVSKSCRCVRLSCTELVSLLRHRISFSSQSTPHPVSVWDSLQSNHSECRRRGYSHSP